MVSLSIREFCILPSLLSYRVFTEFVFCLFGGFSTFTAFLTRSIKVVPSFTGFYRRIWRVTELLPSFTEFFFSFLSSFNLFVEVASLQLGFQSVLWKLYLVLLGFIGASGVLPSFYRVSFASFFD